MKKILLIDGVYPINTRSFRLYETLKKKYEIKFCSWNRNNLHHCDKTNFIYSSNEGYGNKIKKIFGMYAYYKYIKKVNNEYKPDIIMASHWDMLFLCSFLKNKKLIYDNLDMPTSKNRIILKFLKLLEFYLIKNTKVMICASRFFISEYKNVDIKQYVVENLPLKSTLNIKKVNFESEKIKLSFIGTVRYYEILKNLINSLRHLEDKIDFYIIGIGPDEEKLKNLVRINKQKNIKFLGKYDYKEIEKYYKSSDLIWAAYPWKDYNVKHAISNKFFESILYEKPCFFSINTFLGNYVKENKIGFIIDPYNPNSFFENIEMEELKNEIKNINQNIKAYKKNKKMFWEELESDIYKIIDENF